MEASRALLGPEQADEHDSHQRRPRPRKVTIGALIALLLLVNLSTSLYNLPLNRVIERRLCREYYAEHDPSSIDRDGSVAEDLCKVDSVQQNLAFIQGAMDTTWILGDFVMTIPLGFMAERYGQRAILSLNLLPRLFTLSWAVLVGYLEQSLPTRAIMAGPVLSVLGGDCVFNSITYALAAGLTDDYVRRATYFGWMSSVTYVVALLGPALASASMTIRLWLPFFIGIALLLVAAAAVAMLPGGPRPSRPHPSSLASEDQSTRPLISSPVLKAQGESNRHLLRSVLDRLDTLKSLLATHPRNLTLLFTSFFLTSLASSDTKLLPQYMSKRYHWKFADAGYLLSGKAVVNFVLLTVIIPSLLRSRRAAAAAPADLDSQRRPPSQTDRANLGYARYCLAVSVCGALAIGLAPGVSLLLPALLVYALGSALPVFTLSLLKSPAVAPPTDTHLFSMTMMVKTLGSLVGAPLMAVLWMRGIAAGGAALGTPYFVSASCYVLALVVFAGIRV